jgi:hypothetical protein
VTFRALPCGAFGFVRGSPKADIRGARITPARSHEAPVLSAGSRYPIVNISAGTAVQTARTLVFGVTGRGKIKRDWALRQRAEWNEKIDQGAEPTP